MQPGRLPSRKETAPNENRSVCASSSFPARLLRRHICQRPQHGSCSGQVLNGIVVRFETPPKRTAMDFRTTDFLTNLANRRLKYSPSNPTGSSGGAFPETAVGAT